MSVVGALGRFLFNVGRLAALIVILYFAVYIRLDAVFTYGRVIHEFDPWFNYRATEYLVNNGYEKFKTWYDDESWYPLGRPVGSTIYPGMMITASALFRTFEYFDLGISLNDVCVFIPAGFAIFSCIFTCGIAFEATKSFNAALMATFFMAIIPAHLMRSVAGGYDNESVAVAAICSTFYFWLRSLRTPSSWPFAILAGFSYIYMVAAWGGYVFVLNMVGIHAALLTVLQFDLHLHRCYSIFFVIGTIGALQFPIVGWLPLQSLEQLGPLFVFLGMQGLAFLLYCKNKYFGGQDDNKYKAFRMQLISAGVVVAAAGFAFLLSTGWIAGLSNRIRSLFIPHTHTGNPLVDSVAEHQSTPNTVYWHYFHAACHFGPIGFVACFFNRNPGKLFVILYCVLAGYFSRKMIRLVLLLAPAASIASGIGAMLILEWAWGILSALTTSSPAEETEEAKAAKTPKKDAKDAKKASKGESLSAVLNHFDASVLSANPLLRLVQTLGSFLLPLLVLLYCIRFGHHSFAVSSELSHPTIMVKARAQDGSPMIIDDFRQAYWFLRDKTPEGSRVMAWWDYGYQINGIGNRTTIADGNTWNHEHIALLGRCLISPEDQAHRMIRHLADYVLVWTTRYAGMAGDDLAKMPHMARIGASVFNDLNPNDYWMDQQGNASPKLRKSLLYKLHFYKFSPEVSVLTKFEEAYTSPNRMVRIYKVKDVAPRHPVGSYPPALDFVLKKSKAFKQ